MRITLSESKSTRLLSLVERFKLHGLGSVVGAVVAGSTADFVPVSLLIGGLIGLTIGHAVKLLTTKWEEE